VSLKSRCTESYKEWTIVHESKKELYADGEAKRECRSRIGLLGAVIFMYAWPRDKVSRTRALRSGQPHFIAAGREQQRILYESFVGMSEQKMTKC